MKHRDRCESGLDEHGNAGMDSSQLDAFDLEELWKLCERDSSVSAHDPLVGRQCGDVTLLRRIGEGGMGRVYEGVQQKLGRSVAVKVLWPGLLFNEALRRFIDEFIILGRLSHPGISQMFSAGTVDIGGLQVPFFVMEYVHGARSIKDFVVDAGMTVPQILVLFRDVCDAVGHGHANGIVHRDLKPANILVNGSGHSKVIDFGVASRGGLMAGQRLTETGRLVGTLQYMSPEQVRSEKHSIGPMSDVYSLGVVLFELIAGVMPYDVSSSGVVDAASIIEHEKPPPLRTDRGPVPIGLQAVVERCLRKKPVERFADATELRNAIDQIIDFKKTPISMTGNELRIVPKRRAMANKTARVGHALLGAWLGSLACGLGGWAVLQVMWMNMEAEKLSADFSRVVVPGRLVFSHGFRDVFEDRADRYVTDHVGVQKCERVERGIRITSWVPVSSGIEGRLVFRFDFDEPADQIVLRASSTCWGELDRGARGDLPARGASAIEVSPDGSTWSSLADNITTHAWGRNWGFDGIVGGLQPGCRHLWVRIRLVCESADMPLTGAEFARAAPNIKQDIFQVLAFAE